MRVYRLRYSSSRAVVSMAPIFIIHLRSVNSAATVLCLKCAELYKFGAISLGAIPCSHLASQNGVFLPLPIVMYVEAKNSWRSGGSLTLNNCFQGLPMVSQWCHNQRNLSARLNLFRSKACLPIHQTMTSFDMLWILTFPKEATAESINS